MSGRASKLKVLERSINSKKAELAETLAGMDEVLARASLLRNTVRLPGNAEIEWQEAEGVPVALVFNSDPKSGNKRLSSTFHFGRGAINVEIFNGDVRKFYEFSEGRSQLIVFTNNESSASYSLVKANGAETAIVWEHIDGSENLGFGFQNVKGNLTFSHIVEYLEGSDNVVYAMHEGRLAEMRRATNQMPERDET